jgi:hypothetical protein
LIDRRVRWRDYWRLTGRGIATGKTE